MQEDPHKELVVKSKRTLIKLIQKTKEIPSFLQLSEVQCDPTQYSFASGGFSDVYIGVWEQKQVAIKAIRLYFPKGAILKDIQDKLIKVGISEYPNSFR